MNKFLVIFDSIDDSVFQTINNIKNHLDIAYKGKYSLSVDFNSKSNQLVKKYALLATPALVKLDSLNKIYGNFSKKEFLKFFLKVEG